MKHKTAELEGALLDLAVAKVEGIEADIITLGTIKPRQVCQSPHGLGVWTDYNPSAHWGDGGPIIERERIDLSCCSEDGDELFWTAQIGVDAYETGVTPLIAAMRAYVASKFGEEVEL